MARDESTYTMSKWVSLLMMLADDYRRRFYTESDPYPVILGWLSQAGIVEQLPDGRYLVPYLEGSLDEAVDEMRRHCELESTQ